MVKSPKEVSQFVEKIETNRRIHGKNIKWDWLQPLDFLAEHLGELRPDVTSERPDSAQKNDELPIWQAR